MSTFPTPVILIQDLADYVAGRLRGQWFTPTDYADSDDFAAAVAKFLATVPGHEEYSIDDSENIGGLPGISRHMTLDELWVLCSNVAEHGPAYSHWVSNGNAIDSDAQFLESYAGCWDSTQEFAQEYADEMGSSVAVLWPYDCIDWERATRDLMYDYWTGTGNDGVYIFRNE